MVKKKYTKLKGHKFGLGSAVFNYTQNNPQYDGTVHSMYYRNGVEAIPAGEAINNRVTGAPQAEMAGQHSEQEVSGSGGGGGNFLGNASQIAGMASMFDSIAQSVTSGIDVNRKGVSNKPTVLVEGVLGGQSGSHLGNMWNTGAKTDAAIDYVRQQGNVEYVGANSSDLLNQRNSVGKIQKLNIDTTGKEFEDFAFDPLSYIITSMAGKRETAAERQDRINRAIGVSNARQERAYDDALQRFRRNQQAATMSNFAAFGGPLFGTSYASAGATGYDIAKDNALAKQMQIQTKNSTSFNPIFNSAGYDFAEGGGIHIAPSKRGTFTAAAKKHGKSVQAFASQVLANKENYSPAMVKKANFARNAAKWHADGGLLMSDEFTNGVTLINQGGTHENNPHEGVQIGIAPDGTPNLVEEGEAIYKDYVYSNRLRVPKEVRNKYKLRGPKDMTFAEAFRSAQKESEERPNDPISTDGLENIAMILARTQEAIRGYNRATRMAAYGGHLFGDGDYIIYDKDKSSKDYFDKLYAEDSDYMKALAFLNEAANAEERNALIADINSGKYNTENENINGFNVTGDNWYRLATDYKKGPVHNAVLAWLAAKDAKAAASQVESAPVELSPREQYALTGQTPQVPASQQAPLVAAAAAAAKERSGDIEPIFDTTESATVGKSRINPLRLAPIVSGIGTAITDAAGITNSFAPLNYIPAFRGLDYMPLGDYIPETHTDTRYAANRAAQQAAATRDAIMQSTSPNRWANLLAADYNAQINQGDLLRQGELQDYERMLQRKQFNRGTNQYNSETDFKAAIADQDARLRYAQAALAQAQANENLETLTGQARSANYSNLIDSFAGLGEEMDARNDRDWLIAKGVFGSYSEEDLRDRFGFSEDAIKSMKGKSYTGKHAAKGGKLRKKKKGLTY